jgi:hypothetical protein
LAAALTLAGYLLLALLFVEPLVLLLSLLMASLFLAPTLFFLTPGLFVCI